MREVVLVKPELEAAEMDTASRELLRARRGALQDLRRDGIISEEVFGKLSAEVDTMLTDEAGLVPGDRLVIRNQDEKLAEAMVMRVTPTTATALVSAHSMNYITPGNLVALAGN